MQFKTKLSFCLLAMYFLVAISVAADDRKESSTPALKEEVSEITKVLKHEDGDSKSTGIATEEIKNSKAEIPTHHHHIHVHKAVTTESPNSLPRREDKDDEKAESRSDDIDSDFNKSRSGADEVMQHKEHKSRQGYDPPERHNRPIPRGGVDYAFDIPRKPNHKNWCYNTRKPKPYERPVSERWGGGETDDVSNKDDIRGNPKSMSDEGDDLEDDKDDSPPAPYSGPDDRYDDDSEDDDSEDDGTRRVEERRRYPPKLDSLDNTGQHDEAEDQDDDD